MGTTRRAQQVERRTAESRPTATPLSAEGRIDQMLAGVRSAGLKLTPQRVVIVRALADDPTHPTAQEIFDRLQTSMPTMSFATVYNTLDALTNAGLCASLSFSPGPARFDPNMRPHHHAICDGCGLVRDVPRLPAGAETAPAQPSTSEEYETATPALLGFEVRAVEHIYRGLCAGCAAREAPGPAARAAPSPLRRSTLSDTTGETHGHDQPQRNQDASEPEGRLRG